MGRKFYVDYDEFPKEDFVHCSVCKTQIGLVDEFINDMENGRTAIFNKVFNVQVDAEKYHRQENGKIVADTYCVKCGMLLGMKLIVVPYSHWTVNFRQGRFLIRANKLVFWNNERLFDGEDEQDEGANEHDHNQGGGSNEQNNDHNGGVNEHDNDQG
ncbi:uncharacterized protein LOC129898782 [Solanum dulcamara]|uniref:uncharacterized protein LOC129898782 n=1 Tax=Solanum dulcamara TaxID=45834 RepID=UPI002485146F|nr:uncharacterized protein LOC129898782 [Solanum dulcamara]XP_055829434.1 uncharacterized protein LOC129898782 [Solanum dulcamara]